MLQTVGRVYEAMGDIPKARDALNRLLELSHSLGDRRMEASALSGIGHVLEVGGDTGGALEYYRQAIELNRTTIDPLSEVSTLYRIAHALRAAGKLDESLSTSETAIKMIEGMRARVANSALRTSYFASSRQQYELLVDVLMRLHHANEHAALDVKAYEVSERARARALLESLTEARADIRQGIEPALLEREQSLQRMLNARAERQMRLSDKSGKEEAASLDKEIRTLTAEYEDLQGQIRSKSPRYAALTQAQPSGLKEIQQTLDDKTLLLEYGLGDEGSYLWVVSRTAIASYKLPKRAEVEIAARDVYELLTARQPKPGETTQQHHVRVTQAEAQYWQKAASLSEMLLGPVAGELGTNRLLIVAEGALQYLPFGALPKPKSEGQREKRSEEPAVKKEQSQEQTAADKNPSARPLMVDHEIVSLPSASVMAVLRREIQDRQRPSKMVAVLADPVFENDDPRLINQSETQKNETARTQSASHRVTDLRRKALPTPMQSFQVSRPASALARALRDAGLSRDGLSVARLPSTRLEAEVILSTASAGAGLKALDFQASRATATSRELSQYRIVHFATHGLLDSQHPDLSGLVLSLVNESGKPQNGFLRLHDIYNLNLPVELVVLSACNTGLGKDVRGEGLVGIVRGFMYAGAARVVASLWKVDDEATAELMKRFYRSMLQENLPAAAALKTAQFEMWQQKRWRSPYYWAAFVLQGEWR